MKKYIYNAIALALGLFSATSCSPDYQGQEPGNDSKPVVTIYTYEAARPLNPENDVVIRLAANSKVSEAYYLAEKTSEAESQLASLGEAGYQDYVVSKGTKASVAAGQISDLTLTDLYGAYTISVVATNGSDKTLSQTTFTGLEWDDVTTGTYYFSAKTIGRAGLLEEPVATTLQQCVSDKNMYRIKDVFAKGYSLKFTLLPDYTATDGQGTYTYMRVPDQELPATLTYGSYSGFRVRDIGYWQGSDAWVTDKGYEGGMYPDGYCFLMVQYRATSPKNTNFGYNYDYFIPD